MTRTGEQIARGTAIGVLRNHAQLPREVKKISERIVKGEESLRKWVRIETCMKSSRGLRE